MAASDPTILDLKKAFLTTQIRHLSSALRPSPDWTSALPPASPSSPALTPKEITDALTKLNLASRHHHKAAYSTLAARHVAEQIDALYWAQAGGGALIVSGDDDVLERHTDLRASAAAARLPDEWEDEEEGEEAQRAEYVELRARLVAGVAARDRAGERVARVRKLRELVGPLTDAVQNVQPNLAGREGELAGELDRMRLLMARVAARVEALGGEGGAVRRGDEGLGVSSESKVRGILEGGK